MATVLLDTHVVHWRSAEPERLSFQRPPGAGLRRRVRGRFDDLVRAGLACAARANPDQRPGPRLAAAPSPRTSARIPITPEIAAAAAALPSSFPRNPADRLIFATAVEHGFHLVSKDSAIRDHGQPGATVIW